MDGEFVVNVFTVIGDVATASLSDDDEWTYDLPGWTECPEPARPSNHRLETGFVLGPFTVPPLVQHENVSMQVISWATILFGMEDISDTDADAQCAQGPQERIVDAPRGAVAFHACSRRDDDPIPQGQGVAQLRVLERYVWGVERFRIAACPCQLDSAGHVDVVSSVRLLEKPETA